MNQQAFEISRRFLSRRGSCFKKGALLVFRRSCLSTSGRWRCSGCTNRRWNACSGWSRRSRCCRRGSTSSSSPTRTRSTNSFRSTHNNRTCIRLDRNSIRLPARNPYTRACTEDRWESFFFKNLIAFRAFAFSIMLVVWLTDPSFLQVTACWFSFVDVRLLPKVTRPSSGTLCAFAESPLQPARKSPSACCGVKPFPYRSAMIADQRYDCGRGVLLRWCFDSENDVGYFWCLSHSPVSLPCLHNWPLPLCHEVAPESFLFPPQDVPGAPVRVSSMPVAPQEYSMPPPQQQPAGPVYSMPTQPQGPYNMQGNLR